jgi:succinate dehydrogenase flavin-adding protein (antitoxin of CptAB toxin-antitoxin module)
MKELVVLLQRFLERYGVQLNEAELGEFESLLDQEDDVLWDWLQDPRQCPQSGFRPLLEKIRNG